LSENDASNQVITMDPFTFFNTSVGPFQKNDVFNVLVPMPALTQTIQQELWGLQTTSLLEYNPRLSKVQNGVNITIPTGTFILEPLALYLFASAAPGAKQAQRLLHQYHAVVHEADDVLFAYIVIPVETGVLAWYMVPNSVWDTTKNALLVNITQPMVDQFGSTLRLVAIPSYKFVLLPPQQGRSVDTDLPVSNGSGSAGVGGSVWWVCTTGVVCLTVFLSGIK